ncbi:MAG: HlyD family efflux transporter periplasmic adaptor subunit, partial [Gammaproteobacteria bacterium]|nr:HlyD family efflux transporter periplasmic adaptor subunit [Gammaproteobacteria bacterium]
MFKNLSHIIRQFWQQKHNRVKALPFLIVFFTLLLIIIFKLAQTQPPVKSQSESIWTVQAKQLSAGEKAPQLELYGHVESPYTASITSIINADVRSLDVNEGQLVSNGQQLILLDDTEARLAFEEKAAAVAELEAQIQLEKNRYKSDLDALALEKSLVSLAEKKLAREEKTSKSNLTSQSSFDTQKQALNNQKLALNTRQLNVADHPSRLAQLEASLNRARALAQQAQNDLIRASILAPFDGVILKTEVSPGERVRPGEILLQMYATDQVELRAQIPQKFIATIKQALADQVVLYATVKTDSGQISARLNRVSGSLSSTNHGVDALFSVDSSQVDQLTIGDTLEMTLKLPAINDAYSVPVSSIYGTSRIYRIED